MVSAFQAMSLDGLTELREREKLCSVRFETRSFRHGEQLIAPWPEWHELKSVVTGIRQDDILEIHKGVLGSKPVGAQTAINRAFENRLVRPLGWTQQVQVFPSSSYAKEHGLPVPDPPYPSRKIDFMKNHLGVEVVFNNESYLERILFRLNVGSEAEGVIPENEVVAGVIVIASDRVKKWGRMDPSVATFEGAGRTLELVKHAFSVPLLVVGLFPDDEEEWPLVCRDFSGPK